jgi:hypothetical protein
MHEIYVAQHIRDSLRPDILNLRKIIFDVRNIEGNILLRYQLAALINLMFVDPCIILQFIRGNPTRCNSVSKFIIQYLYKVGQK